MDDDQIAEAWIDALRSGKYKQTDGALRSREEDGTYCHCVVGVLADVVDPNAWTGTSEGYLYHEQDGEYNELPTNEYPLVYWRGSAFGVGKEIPGIPYDVINTAMGMNDGDFKNFEEIATYLEDALATGSVG